jgi:hypothetical protein
MPSKKLTENHKMFGALPFALHIQLGEQSSHMSRLSIGYSNILNMSPHMHVCGQDFRLFGRARVRGMFLSLCYRV